MGQIFVFAKDADDFDSMGLCGPLTPTSAKFTEAGNDTSELAIEHPIDALGRWKHLKAGNILQASVPVRTVPEIKSGAIVTSVEKWHVKSTATSDQRGVYTKASGGKRLKRLKTGDEVYVVDKDSSRYKIKMPKYTGWIAVAAIEYDLTTIIDDDPAAIETVIPAWTVRPQLFRIYSPVKSDKGVTAKARHVSYDNLGNITIYDAENPTCQQALDGIHANCVRAHDVVARTNIADQRMIEGWTRVSPIDALMAPETGLLAKWNAEIVRDNWEITVLKNAGLNRGVRIAYGKNLLGVECTVDETDLITGILPVGQDSKGNPRTILYSGSIVMDGYHLQVTNGVVESPYINDYPVPHVYTMELGDQAKAASKKASDLTAADLKMIKAANDKFLDEQCDLPSLTLKVTFINLGDTAEYRQYKRLEDVYLYDRVQVYHPGIGVDVLTKVNRIVWDALNDRVDTMELGMVRRNAVRSKVSYYQLGNNIPGRKIKPYSIDAGQFSESAAKDLDLSGNPAAWQVSVGSSAGPVLFWNPSASTNLVAKVVAGAADKTDEIDASRFRWKRNSGDAVADAAWAAAHIGVKSVALTAAELATTAIYTSAIVDEMDADSEIASGTAEISYQPRVNIPAQVMTLTGTVDTETQIDNGGFKIVRADNGEFLGGTVAYADTSGNPRVAVLGSIFAKAAAGITTAGVDGGYAYPSNRFYAPYLAEKRTDGGNLLAASHPFGLTFVTTNDVDEQKFSGFFGGGWGVMEEQADGSVAYVDAPYLYLSSQRIENVIGGSLAYLLMYKQTAFLRGTLKVADQPGSRKGLGEQSGRAAFSVAASSTATVTVTFPTAFEAEPILTTGLNVLNDTDASSLRLWMSAKSATAVTFKIANSAAYLRSGYIEWRADGTIIEKGA